MTEISFPTRWLPETPDVIQLYSMATPNGQKISVALEEMELAYEPHLINIINGDQHDPEFAQISPMKKYPP